jgi:hypothetical protein
MPTGDGRKPTRSEQVCGTVAGGRGVIGGEASARLPFRRQLTAAQMVCPYFHEINRDHLIK